METKGALSGSLRLFRFQDVTGKDQAIAPEHIVLIKPGKNGGTLIFTLQPEKHQNVYHLNESLGEVTGALSELVAHLAQTPDAPPEE